MEKRDTIKPKHKGIGFLIDMDGVIYKGSELIPGAREFIQMLISEKIPFLFLTNNSQRSRRDVCFKLQKMGILVSEEHIFTCAMATARFLALRKPAGTAYVIGEGGLITALHHNGYTIVDDEPDFVIIGEGRTILLESVDKAINMVMKGSKLIATNMDPNCPHGHNQIRAGCGAFTSMIEKATGKQAFSVGKPSPVMMKLAKDTLNTHTANTFMLGDTMSTDILGATQMGFNSILTLTGVTQKEDLKQFAYSPDFIIPSIDELNDPEIFEGITGHKMTKKSVQTRYEQQNKFTANKKEQHSVYANSISGILSKELLG